MFEFDNPLLILKYYGHDDVRIMNGGRKKWLIEDSLISGIVVSALWAVPFAGKILRENTILSGASIRPAGSVNASTQVIDTSRPISLAIHVERNNGTAVVAGQIPNNSLRETVRNPNGIVMTNNNFTRQFLVNLSQILLEGTQSLSII